LEPFRWHDGERIVVFGRGTLAQAPALLETGYVVLTTPRARAAAPEVVAGAGAVFAVASGRVDELAAGLRLVVQGELLVALGGGRVIDVAKALAAADPPRRVAAIPTTLSGAEMTAVHRRATGAAAGAPGVRPAVVINDPSVSASQPVAELAASAANALGHAAEGPLTPLTNPVATFAALEAARLIALVFGGAGAEAGSGAGGAGSGAGGAGSGAGGAVLGEPDRDALALAALLAGYVIGSTGYGLHHVLSQTLVRFAGLAHGEANAIMLQHTLGALGRRAPGAISRLGEALGEDPPAFAARLCGLTGVVRLRDAGGVAAADLELYAREAASRPELHLTPPAADAAELLELYRAAF
jgi:alcohol dehydrogenase class IV